MRNISQFLNQWNLIDLIYLRAVIVATVLQVVLVVVMLSSCTIKEVNPINKVIIGCVCNDGTIPIYRPDILTEKSFIASSMPCTANGGIKEFIYKN